MATAVILRVILNAGHGLGNTHPHVYDSGAVSAYGVEAAIVEDICNAVSDQFWKDPAAQTSVIPTPICSEACVPSHPFKRGKNGKPKRDSKGNPLRSGHLAYVVQWVNSNAIRAKDGKYRDFLLSVHMNSADNPDASGVEVIYPSAVPARRALAASVSRAVAAVLELPDRGAKSEAETARGELAILNDTNPPALLIELGFVSNPCDVERVRERGVKAVIAAIEQIVKDYR